MAKIWRKLKKKFDRNNDGKVNLKDLFIEIEKKVDTDDNGHVDINELANAFEKAVEFVNIVKAGV